MYRLEYLERWVYLERSKHLVVRVVVYLERRLERSMNLEHSVYVAEYLAMHLGVRLLQSYLERCLVVEQHLERST